MATQTEKIPIQREEQTEKKPSEQVSKEKRPLRRRLGFPSMFPRSLLSEFGFDEDMWRSFFEPFTSTFGEELDRRTPLCNVKETPDHYYIECELPGLY